MNERIVEVSRQHIVDIIDKFTPYLTGMSEKDKKRLIEQANLLILTEIAKVLSRHPEYQKLLDSAEKGPL